MRFVNYFVIATMAYGQLAFAQLTSGTISGAVKDTSEGVIPGATVVLKNVDTGLVRTLTTNQRGRYQAPNLSLGNYEVEARTDGFQAELRTGIRLTVGREAVVDFVLRPGAVAETVTVTGEAPLVDTTSAAVTGLVDDRDIQSLPLNARSFHQLVLLQVGTIENLHTTGGGNVVHWRRREDFYQWPPAPTECLFARRQ